MINRVILVGRLTKDVELRKTNSNTSVCSFTLACNRRYAQQGAQQTADFINCIAWRQSAEFLAKYASKGAIVGVEGRISTRSYDGQNGKVYVTEVTCDSVQLIGGNRNGSSNNEGYTNNQTFTPNNEASYTNDSLDDDFSNTPSLDISSDDLPFY
ncbi:MAG: single-stranded DNA-binding protein [Firmicutes bacterium]|nr:single-stranded DNA-binding protein [Candidatus Colivicinus equi]